MIINILTKLDLVSNRTLRDIVFNRTDDYIPRNPQLLEVIGSILKSRNHLEKIIEVIDEGIIAYDEGQHIILFNEVAEKIFGIPIWKAKMMTLSECFSEVSLAIENPEEFCDAVQRHTPQFPRRPDPQNEDDALAHILLLMRKRRRNSPAGFPPDLPGAVKPPFLPCRGYVAHCLSGTFAVCQTQFRLFQAASRSSAGPGPTLMNPSVQSRLCVRRARPTVTVCSAASPIFAPCRPKKTAFRGRHCHAG